MGKLEDRVAVITGGIGLAMAMAMAMARVFAAEGAKVVVPGRRRVALDDALREIGTADSSQISLMDDHSRPRPPRGLSAYG